MNRVMIALMEDARQIQVKVSAQAYTQIEHECERLGMTKVAMFSRLVAWFSAQDDVTRMAVLGMLPPSIAPDVAAAALRKIAERREKKSAG
jgi:hypothetical protein